ITFFFRFLKLFTFKTITSICQQNSSAVEVKGPILTVCIDSSSTLSILKMHQIYIFYSFTVWSCFLLVFEGMYIKLAAEIKYLNVTKEKKNIYKKFLLQSFSYYY
ncbi:unnamed protein product, partial [Ixodes pacificus]